MGRLEAKKDNVLRRKMRIKSAVKPRDLSRLRLCISKSNKSLYAQIIDDLKGNTLVGISSLCKDFASLKSRKNIEAAKELGKLLAKKAKEKGISKVFFDRNGNLYHGKIQAFAESARENGLEF